MNIEDIKQLIIEQFADKNPEWNFVDNPSNETGEMTFDFEQINKEPTTIN